MRILSSGKVETGRSEVQGYPWLQSQFKASLSYERVTLTKQTRKEASELWGSAASKANTSLSAFPLRTGEVLGMFSTCL